MAEVEKSEVPFDVEDSELVRLYSELPDKCQRCPGVLEVMGG